MKLKSIIVLLFISFIFVTACSDGNEQETIVLVKNDETYLPRNVYPVLDEIQRKTFNFFYEGAEPATGMIYEGTERGNIITTGGTGFGLMSLIIGSERKWISRSQAGERTLKICQFLKNCERFNGAWSHWYTPDGLSADFGEQVKTGDLVETGLLMQGLIAAKEYYKGSSNTENNISRIIDELWGSVDWKHYTNSGDALYWLWSSENNQFSLPINGWNEGLITYIMALAAPTPHNIDIEVYKKGWKQNGAFYHPNRTYYNYTLLLGPDYGGSLFLSQYSMLGLNPQKLEDNDINYWYQNVNHTLINRHYCIYNAPEKYAYSDSSWGLTACYGIGTQSQGEYKPRSPLIDDGVIAPTAALGAYPYTPFYSTQVLLGLNKLGYLKHKYGFSDAFCPSENIADKRVLAIDQGPIVVMIENYRTGLIWNLVMGNENIQKGLRLADIKTTPGFKEGFHLAVIDQYTKVYNMLIHPDRDVYELDYFVENGEVVKFTIKDANNKIVREKEKESTKGENVFSFFDDNILRGREYLIEMQTKTSVYKINVVLR
ncbi:hypothetical protein JGH11_03000 [Dysgonomonas sp. Marseille-P4677]|uniref:glucoamylase family protein n=1 Tax=Dysgonomonas sp. Marseille-P4677 TaxID=2364790 RepID=UPI0019123EE8|nr:glucoamylase family protein [Dysgonomonas sp. Marseille-P4677]MBK5719834.1 hypothetical protein [Dysgonomonas sp. Marseille-P4677]